MKQLIVTIIISIFLTSYAFTHICVNGNVNLNSQTAVNNFVNNYSTTCTEINGDLTLTGSTTTDISGLSFLLAEISISDSKTPEMRQSAAHCTHHTVSRQDIHV